MAHGRLYVRFTGGKKRMDIKDTVLSLFKPLALGTYRA